MGEDLAKLNIANAMGRVQNLSKLMVSEAIGREQNLVKLSISNAARPTNYLRKPEFQNGMPPAFKAGGCFWYGKIIRQDQIETVPHFFRGLVI